MKLDEVIRILGETKLLSPVGQAAFHAIEELKKKAELEMAIEELIEKYKLERDEHIIECSKGDASRLKNEQVANKLTQVVEDLEEVMK